MAVNCNVARTSQSRKQFTFGKMAVFLQSVSSPIWFNLEKQSCLSHEFLVDELRRNLGITSQNVPCKFFQGSSEILPGSSKPWPETDVFVRTTISLVGGKGGFGSMLRFVLYNVIPYY